MTNREWLIDMSIHDLLSGISDYGEGVNEDFCILDAVKGTGGNCTDDCKACLQVWLQQEVKDGNY